MPEVTERISVRADVEQVSMLVADPGRLAEWHPAIASSAMEGSVRHLVFADGPAFDERITARTDHSYSYVIDENPFPLDEFASTLSVEADDGGSTISWTGRFRPREISDAEASELLAGLFRAGLESIGQRLG